MKKDNLFLAVSVISLLLMGVAVFNPFSGNSSAKLEAANDFHQRHPDWIWTANNQNALVPITGAAAFPDYHQRHPELSKPAVLGIGASDYFQRHPEWTVPAVLGIGASDYFQRHPELTASADASADLTDFYFRQQALQRSGRDLTDYYFRHPGN